MTLPRANWVWLGLLLSVPAFSDHPADTVVLQSYVFEDFSSDKDGSFPKNWKARGWKGKAEKVYRVKVEKDNRYLHALDRGEDIQIGKYKSWDPNEFPILSFRWRAKQLPKGAAENNSATNDSAAGIFVIFKGGFVVPPGIKFVWSATLPVSEANVSYKDLLKCVVLQSGTQHLGKWTTHEVNFVELYKKHFGKDKVPGIQGIGIFTDANATKSVAEADYDDIILRRKFSKEPAPGTFSVMTVEP